MEDTEASSKMHTKKVYFILSCIYVSLFFMGIKALFHGFPDIERFFAEWMDERLALGYIMKFGTLNFVPSEIWHPPLYYYLSFIPVALFYAFGKFIGLFHDKIEFVRFYFYNTHYFFLIGRIMSYIFYWLTAIVIFKISRLFYGRAVSHISVITYLLVPRFIFDFSTTRPETLLFLTCSTFFYYFLRFYLNTNRFNYLYLCSFFIGVSTATKYNALFLVIIFIPLLFYLKKKGLNSKKILSLYAKICFFVFLGFFICNPFFIIMLKKFLYNFITYNKEVRTRWYGSAPAFFVFTHAKDLSSLFYINVFGTMILILGGIALLKKNKWLFSFLIFTIFVFEVYFVLFQEGCSPLRYLNPVLPLAILIFSAGVNFIISQRKRLIFILALFSLMQIYNYFAVWHGFSFGQTYVQEARAFIEKNIPEYAKICLIHNAHFPQLNMTKESYYHLINTAPDADFKGQKIIYEKVGGDIDSNDVIKDIRIESLMQKPQYNIVRWDSNIIKTTEDATKFLKKNKIEYVVASLIFKIGDERLGDIKGLSLVKEFRPKNMLVYGNDCLYLYRVDIK